MKYVTPFIGLCGLTAVIFWTYNTNYQTRQAFDRLDALRGEIAAEGEAIRVLSVEWAWLNRPERLRRLIADHEESLRLTHLRADHFAAADTVPFPPLSEETELEETEEAETLASASGAALFSASSSSTPAPRPRGGAAAFAAPQSAQ